MRVNVPVIAFLTVAAALRGESDLDRVVTAYSTVRGYQIEAVVTNQLTRGSASYRSKPPEQERRKILIAWSAPDRLRLENEEPSEITLFHDNGMASYMKGRSSWVTGPANDPLRQNDALSRGKAMAKIGFTDYAAIKHNLGSAHVLRQEEVSVDGVSIPCMVIEARYAHGETRTLWVDAGY